MEMDFKISYFILVIILSSLLITGMDFTHHSHNSWLYNQMIKNGVFLEENPYFTSQITYAYGVPAYFISGLVWFLFSIHSINLIQGVTIIINFLLLKKWFENDLEIGFLILLNLLFTIFDAYVAAFSNCLFWIASYGYFNKKKWWVIPLLISAFNHPYVLISSLFFAVQEPILILPLSLILSYFLVATRVFTSDIYFPVYTLAAGAGRMLLNLLPIMLLTARGKLKLKNFKLVEEVSKIKVNLPTVFGLLIIGVAVTIFLSSHTLVLLPENLLVEQSIFKGIPKVNGTVRAVDYLYLPSVYILPYYDFNLQAGSFRENNPQHMISLTWSNKTEYEDFLNEQKVDYVLMCKMCNPKSNEKTLLTENYPVTWENEYYYLYNVT